MILRTQRRNRLTALRLVHPRSTETGTLRNAFFSALSSTVRKISSYREKLRSGLVVDIKKDDAVSSFPVDDWVSSSSYGY
ncbi:hypothetical protein Bca4012_089843 [Brassica carinata]|uniref:Uncharacterized protein n=1 Tax=Brassica oleracea var. oleracea TaxID=109376 RepID=A0A0D3AB20_BRAOL